MPLLYDLASEMEGGRGCTFFYLSFVTWHYPDGSSGVPISYFGLEIKVPMRSKSVALQFLLCGAIL